MLTKERSTCRRVARPTRCNEFLQPDIGGPFTFWEEDVLVVWLGCERRSGRGYIFKLLPI